MRVTAGGFLFALAYAAAGCGGGSDKTRDGARDGALPGDATLPTDLGDAAVVEEPVCGFVMPNSPQPDLPNTARYDVTEANVVTEQVSGLMWERTLSGHASAEGCTTNITGLLACPLRYADAYCKTSRLSGYADWRLPTILELMSLANFAVTNPAIDEVAFPDTPTEAFWTSTRLGDGRRDYAWLIDFMSGLVSTAFIDGPHRVRCVRSSGTPPERCARPSARFGITGDLVTDALTGLIWERSGLEAAEGLPATQARCAARGVGSRLPSLPEVMTIVDFTKTGQSGPTIDTTAFPRPPTYVWTASPNLAEVQSIWTYSFQDGTPAVTGGYNQIIGVLCVQ